MDGRAGVLLLIALFTCVDVDLYEGWDRQIIDC